MRGPADPPTRAIRILVVDDEPNHLRLLTATLRLEGFHAIGVPDAESALRLLGEGSYDLALVDVMMPGTSGLDLARQMKVAHPGVRVVLMSAYHLSERQLRNSQTGAVGFVAKPYQVEELTQYLRTKATWDEHAA
ncbi:MAG: response regulator [Deltaproteobacteria bacterium]|nr:response regulator [Deltaproteobacteria bacterium]